MWRDARCDPHRSVGCETNGGALEAADLQPDRLIGVARSDAPHLDVAAVADSACPAVGGGGRGFGDQLAGPQQGRPVVAVVELDQRSHLVGELVGGDHVHLAQLDRVDSEILCN